MNMQDYEMYRLKKLEEKLASFDKKSVIKVRINYLISIMKVLGKSLDKKSNKKLNDLLQSKTEQIELLKKLGRSYIEMTVEEFEYLLKRTNKLNIDKSMLVIFDNYSKTKRK